MVNGTEEEPTPDQEQKATTISRLRRGTAIVFAGSVLGYGINYLASPALGRLVDPATFGTFSSVLALASLFTGVSTMRLEIFSASVSSPAHQQNAQRLALLSTLATSIFVAFGCAIASHFGGLSSLYILAGPMVFVGSLQLIATARYSIDYRYIALGGGNFTQGAGTGIAQLGLAAISPTAISLVGGFIIARTHWFPAACSLDNSRLPLAGTWRRARKFAVPAGSSAFINSAGGQAPILLMSALFGASSAGVFAMAVRLLVGPLAIVAQSIGSTSMGTIGRLAAAKDPLLPATVDSLGRQLALLMLAPCLIAGISAPWLVTLLLGADWKVAGTIIQVLAIGAYAQAVASPLTQVLNLTHNSSSLLKWDTARLASILCTFIAIPLLGGGVVAVSIVYSASMLVLYTAALIMVRQATRRLVTPAGQ